MSITVELTSDHGYVLISAALIAMHIITIGFSVMKERGKAFNPQFLSQNFGEEHKKVTGQDISKTLGYPDMGNGYYAKKLSYEAWYNFANVQRTHYNYLEQIASCLILLLTAGVLYPKYASYCAVTYLVGRVMYTFFYRTQKGAKHPLREVGSILSTFSIFGNFIITFYSGLKIAKII